MQANEMGPLSIHPENPRYFANPTGGVVYLTGSHTWAALQERGIEGETPDFNYIKYLDFLKEYNHNFLRMWSWEHATWMQFREREVLIRYTPTIYMRTGPGTALDGKPKFDVKKFNPIFFERLRSRVSLARERGLYVGVMLFQGFSVEQKGQKGVDRKMGNPWDGHPFNKSNNINQIDGDIDRNGEGEEVHTLADPAVVQLQESYVRKMVDTLNDFDNIIWEISNESHGDSTEWQYHMIQFIKKYEQTKPQQHPTWMSFQASDHSEGTNENLFKSPAEAISPGKEGGYVDEPPASGGEKVIIVDTDHLDPWLQQIKDEWAWKSFLRGLNPIVMDEYMDFRAGSPDQPVVKFESIRKALGQTKILAQHVNLANMYPHGELCSSKYCLADPGKEYLAFKPELDEVIWINLPPGVYKVSFYDSQLGKFVKTEELIIKEQSKWSKLFPFKKKQQIVCPFEGLGVVHIKRKSVP
ncbi:DUF6298 domain-containing protein [Desulfocastanea catecholica]